MCAGVHACVRACIEVCVSVLICVHKSDYFGSAQSNPTFMSCLSRILEDFRLFHSCIPGVNMMWDACVHRTSWCECDVGCLCPQNVMV